MHIKQASYYTSQHNAHISDTQVQLSVKQVNTKHKIYNAQSKLSTYTNQHNAQTLRYTK